MAKTEDQCERCGRPIKPDEVVWLMYDPRVNACTDNPTPLELGERFPFGPECAEREKAVWARRSQGEERVDGGKARYGTVNPNRRKA